MSISSDELKEVISEVTVVAVSTEPEDEPPLPDGIPLPLESEPEPSEKLHPAKAKQPNKNAPKRHSVKVLIFFIFFPPL